jgi:hypothetical protein
VRDEIEGLRAFAVRVECYAGGKYPEEPRAVELGGRRLAVAEVIARWGENDRLGWRVRLEDGRTVLLYYVPEYDLWSVVDPA